MGNNLSVATTLACDLFVMCFVDLENITSTAKLCASVNKLCNLSGPHCLDKLVTQQRQS